uniref:Uncharacterized protein n=1 Tax=Anguilla anguilla TaxID=7936 RepID=A0A0E9T6V4_ANGAN
MRDFDSLYSALVSFSGLSVCSTTISSGLSLDFSWQVTASC